MNNRFSYDKMLISHFLDEWLVLLKTLKEFDGNYDDHLSNLIDLVIDQKKRISKK
jgi:hypothetical protein